jgi:hypothetical protein
VQQQQEDHDGYHETTLMHLLPSQVQAAASASSSVSVTIRMSAPQEKLSPPTPFADDSALLKHYKALKANPKQNAGGKNSTKAIRKDIRAQIVRSFAKFLKYLFSKT